MEQDPEYIDPQLADRLLAGEPADVRGGTRPRIKRVPDMGSGGLWIASVMQSGIEITDGVRATRSRSLEAPLKINR